MAIEYQRFADRWFKFCVRVPLDPVSALNLWWNSGSSFCFGLNDAIPVAFWAFSCFRCIQSLWFASFVWSPLLTLLWAKIVIFVGYLMDGWRIFVGALFESSTAYKELSSKKCRISAKVSSKKCDNCLFLSSKKCDYLLQCKLFFFINLSYNK